MTSGVYERTEETRIRISNGKKGKKLSKVTKRKISESHKGKKLSEEHKRKISKGGKGRIPWNKGLTKETDERVKKYAELTKGIKKPQMCGENHPMFGKKHTVETKRKMRVAKKGKPSHMLGKKHSEKTKRKISKSKKGENHHMYGKKHSEKSKKKMSVSMKGNKNSTGKKHSQKSKIKSSATKQGIDIKDWNGFVSCEPYDQNWNSVFKKLIRKREGNICFKCGKSRKEEKKELSVHHIDYNKKNSIKENCCALCNSCNIKVNKNRKHWTKFFQSLLKEKYGYKY